MSETIDLVRALESELTERIVPVSAHDLSERLNPLTLQLSQQGPVLSKDTRMFRIRPMDYKPGLIDEVGAPSQGKIRIGRLNDQDHRVLYLADSPDTAFAERRVNPGELCLLSEWRVNVEQLVMANGGIPQANFAQYFPSDVSQNVLPIFTPREYTQEILDLFRQIYTMDVGQNTSLYRWSIACGLVNGFSSQCDRKNVEETIDGMTKWSGRYPFCSYCISQHKNR